MRLIDADEALRLFGEEYEETKELIHNGETQLDSLAEGFTEAYHIIKYVVPTVDAVEVVRCKECKHCGELNRKDRIEEAYADGVLWCTNQSDGVWPDDYCSYGERRGGGEDG